MKFQPGSYFPQGCGRRLATGAVLLAVSVGAVFLTPLQIAQGILRHGAYFWALALAILLFWRTVPLVRTHGASVRRVLGLPGILPVLAGGWILFVHADFNFKVTMDDYVLASSARSLHLEREYFVATHGYWANGDFKLSAGYLDKRPWAYPFAVSLLHDLTGWRAGNGFVLNAAAAVLLLAVVGRLGGAFLPGTGPWIAVLALAGVPLLAQNASGGGMDLLNLLLLATTILFAGRFLKAPDPDGEAMLVLLAILLAYSRYESVLFLLPTGIVLLIGWRRAGRVFLTLPTLLAAPLLTGYFLQNRLFRNTETLWELPGGVESAFGLGNLAANLPKAIYFFFNFSPSLANSPAVSLLGVGALVLLAVSCFSRPDRWRRVESQLLAFGLYAFFVFVNFVILMCYHDGELDRIFASRLALPFYLVLCLAIVAAVGRVERRREAAALSLAALVFGILAWTLPANSSELFSRRNYVQNDMDWLIREFGPRVGPEDLVVDQRSTAWTLSDKTALRPYLLLENLEWVKARHESGFYREIYFIERRDFEIVDGRAVLRASALPPGVLELEPVLERSFRPFSVMKVSRVRALHPDRLPPDYRAAGADGEVADYTFDGL